VSCPACDGLRAAPHWKKSGYDLWRCPDCGLIWVHPIPTDEALARYYEQEFFQGGAVVGYADYDAAWRKRNYRRDARALERAAPPGRLLDVGCATGDFLDACSDRWEKYGVEVSRFAGEQAQRKYGERIRIAPLKDAGFPDGFFDAVTLWETLNHLNDPAGDLARCARLLKPGGRLVLNVGDATSLLARLLGRYWYQVTPPVHLFYFTPASLDRMLRAAGLTPESRHYPGKFASLSATLERFKDTTGSPGLVRVCRRLSALGLGRLVYYINLRDTMVVAARKPAEGAGA
jgi:SAM-dependent methyltransferase